MVTVNANLGSNKNTITQLGEETKAYNEKILMNGIMVEEDIVMY